MKRTAVLVSIVMIAIVLVGTGCARKAADTGGSKPPATDPGASGTSAAPGVSKLDDGRQQAIGTVARGGDDGTVWLLRAGTGSTESEQNEVVVVIANSAEFEQRLKELEGKQVIVIGSAIKATVEGLGPSMNITQVEVTAGGSGAAE